MTFPIRRAAGGVAAAVLFSLTLAGHALAQEYVLLVYERPSDFAARTDPARAEAYWGGFAALGAEMQAAGIVRGGSPFTAPGEGAVVQVRDGRTVSRPVDGAGEALSGYFIIAAPDLKTAEGWAARVPAAAGARVEVRPLLAIPGMSADMSGR